MRILVDGMNVVGARPDGWWRDRRAARERLVGDLAGLVGRGDEVTVVFDGRDDGSLVAEARASGVDAVFAPGGPDAADLVIADMATALAGEGEPFVVVTSDRELAAKVKRLGGQVEGSRSFRARIEG